MATIDSLMTASGPDIYYNKSFRNMLEDHMTYLRTHPQNQVMEVTPMQAHRYEFDLIGLLNTLMIPQHLHWVVARMNHFDSFNHVPEDLTRLLIPEQKELVRLQQTFMTVNKIS